MSAPRKIWANVDLYDTFSGKGICGEWNHCDVGSADDTVYHHDDVVRELRQYAQHKRNCDLSSAFIDGKFCTCGYEALLASMGDQ